MTDPIRADNDEGAIDFSEAAEAYRGDRLVAAIVDQIACRQREPKNAETRVRIVRNGLQLAGVASSDDFLSALQKLADAGCGDVQLGRPREESRLIWRSGISAIRVAQRIQLVARGEVHRAGQERDDAYEDHVFPVRPGVRMTLRVRSDLSADELENLADFVRVIARSRRTPP